jgi:DNA-binding response OmpR family regulator
MEARILIIEDEEKLARFIELELGYEGCRVTKAPDGRRGWSWPRAARSTLCFWTSCFRTKRHGVLRRLRRSTSMPLFCLRRATA